MERLWSDLPADLLGLILARLFAGDYFTFGEICKAWRSISIPPAFRHQLPPSIDSPLSRSPCLMILDDDVGKFFHPICNATYTLSFPELSGARIRFSSRGWLLMSQGSYRLFFFNPFTRVKIELPELPTCNTFLTLCFSSVPTSSDCLVTGFTFAGRLRAEFCVIKCGDAQWVVEEFNCDKPFFLFNNVSVFFGGRFYFMGCRGKMGIFDVSENRHSWKVCGKPFSWWRNYQTLTRGHKVRKCFMVEDDGGILTVFIFKDFQKPRILRFIELEMTWKKVSSLGDRMLFLSNGASLSEPAMTKGMGNKLYFSKLYGDNGIFYSPATEKYHSFDGRYACETPSNLVEPGGQSSCAWIKLMS